MNRLIIFIYGVLCYVLFFLTFLYAIGFIGNLLVSKTIDSGIETSLGLALLVNVSLLGIFGIQHSVMARPVFKKWWTRSVPKPAERSTYVLFSSLSLILLFWLWQPISSVVWDIQNQTGRMVLWSLFIFGWLLVLISTFLINHFDLFGLRQVYLYLRGQEYTYLQFRTPGPYNYVRHPLYVGWFFAFWAIPTMTVGHLVFAIVTATYILIAIQFEERDLVKFLGEPYAAYRRRVPMLIPFLKKKDDISRKITDNF